MYNKYIISFLVILSVLFTVVLGSCEAEETKFEAGNLIIEPSSALAGQSVSVSVDVTNTGGIEGTLIVTLLVNCAEDSNKNVTLAPGASQTVVFNLSRDMAGEYEIEVAGMKGELAVVDLDDIFEKTVRAMSAIESYHFTCTLDIELSLPEDSINLFEELP